VAEILLVKITVPLLSGEDIFCLLSRATRVPGRSVRTACNGRWEALGCFRGSRQ